MERVKMQQLTQNVLYDSFNLNGLFHLYFDHFDKIMKDYTEFSKTNLPRINHLEVNEFGSSLVIPVYLKGPIDEYLQDLLDMELHMENNNVANKLKLAINEPKKLKGFIHPYLRKHGRKC